MGCRSIGIFVLSVLSSGVMAGGWTWTNAWESPRGGRVFASECYSSIVERATAIKVSPPTAPTWWRFQKTMLENYKTWTKTYCEYFVRTNLSVGGSFENLCGGLVYTNYDAGHIYDVAIQNRIRLRLTNLYQELSMPTNYFDYTPYRSLCGLGGSTNDASVGHPHGFTNAYTWSGGTNFPAGRDTWYTTDYGWDELRRCINKMEWTMITSAPNVPTNYCGYELQWYHPWQATWADAKAWGEPWTNFLYIPVWAGDTPYGVWSRGMASHYPTYRADGSAYKVALLAGPFSVDAVPRIVDWYVYAATPTVWGISPTNTYNPDYNGESFSQTSFVLRDSSGLSTNTYMTGDVIGGGSNGTQAAWCVAPSTPPTNYIYYIKRGYEFVDFFNIEKWDFTYSN